MRILYSRGSEAIETVYTYDEWLREYNHRETKRRIKQRAERLYYIKQRLSGGNNGNYRNHNSICIGWRCNDFACSVSFRDILDDYTRKGYDILEGRY